MLLWFEPMFSNKNQIKKSVKLLKPWEYISHQRLWVIICCEIFEPVFPMLWISLHFGKASWTKVITVPLLRKYWWISSVSNYNPLAFDVIYLHKYSHGFSNFTDILIQFLLKNIGSNHGNTNLHHYACLGCVRKPQNDYISASVYFHPKCGNLLLFLDSWKDLDQTTYYLWSIHRI